MNTTQMKNKLEFRGIRDNVCVPLFDHRSSACMCVHVREHTCDVNKGEPICSAKFEYSLRVCGCMKANVYVIVCDLGAMLEEGNG